MDNLKVDKPPKPKSIANVLVGNFAGLDLLDQYGVVIIGDDIRTANSMEVKIGNSLMGIKLEEPVKMVLVQLCTKLRDLQMEKVNMDGLWLENDDNKIRPNS